jgi:hypothetical protein
MVGRTKVSLATRSRGKRLSSGGGARESRVFGASDPVTRRNLTAARRVLTKWKVNATVKAIDEIVVITPKSRMAISSLTKDESYQYTTNSRDETNAMIWAALKKDLDSALITPWKLQEVGYMGAYFIKDKNAYKVPKRSWGAGWRK